MGAGSLLAGSTRREEASCRRFVGGGGGGVRCLAHKQQGLPGVLAPKRCCMVWGRRVGLCPLLTRL